LLLARPPVLSAARVKENCFSLSFITAPSCQSWRRGSTGKFCRYSGGFARSATGGGGRQRPSGQAMRGKHRDPGAKLVE
jgi:hypothetical protein